MRSPRPLPSPQASQVAVRRPLLWFLFLGVPALPLGRLICPLPCLVASLPRARALPLSPVLGVGSESLLLGACSPRPGGWQRCLKSQNV